MTPAERRESARLAFEAVRPGEFDVLPESAKVAADARLDSAIARRVAAHEQGELDANERQEAARVVYCGERREQGAALGVPANTLPDFESLAVNVRNRFVTLVGVAIADGVRDKPVPVRGR